MHSAKLHLFDQFDEVQHFFVSDFRVSTIVGSPMAVWAKADHEARVVWSTIAHAANVMNFQEGCTAWCGERRRMTAVFAFALGTSKYIVSHGFASFVDSAGLGLTLAWFAGCRSESTFAKCCEISSIGFNRRFGHSLNHSIEWSKLKNKGVPHRAFCIWCSAFEKPFNNVLAFEAKPVLCLAEKQEVFAVLGVVDYCFVATQHDHVADLTFAEILEDTVRPQAVFVTVLTTFFARHNDDEVMFLRRDYPALLLAGKLGVNVLAPIVGATYLKSPCHRRILSYQKVRLTFAGRLIRVERQREGGILNFALIQGTGGGRSAQETPNITFSERKAS